MNYAEYKEQVLGEYGAEARQRRHAEDDLQAAVCTFLKWKLPEDAEFWAVPNGGKRHGKEAARMTRLGTKAGVPDIHLAYAGRLFCMELKSPTGELSLVQVQMISKLLRCGVPTVVVRSLEDVERTLRNWAIPLNSNVNLS